MTSDQQNCERRFGPLPLADMTAEQRAVADDIRNGPRQSTTGLQGPFDALLHCPPLADAVQRVGEHVRFSSTLPTKLNEMAIIMTARFWDSSFEWYAHRRMALDAGLDLAIIHSIESRVTPPLDGDGTAVYAFTSQLLESGTVDDDAWTAVLERWGKEGAINLIGTIGYYCLISFILNVDRYPTP